MAKSPGRKRGLSRAQIETAAVELIDREGVEGLTMRALGRACGVQAMSLYRYFANKDELLDAVQAHIVTKMEPVDATRPWPKVVEATARELRRVLALHPRSIILFVRPAATEGAFVRLEQVWTVLMRAGFGELDALRALQSLLAFVVGQALWQFTPGGEREADDEFEFGLDVILRGLADRLESASET